MATNGTNDTGNWRTVETIAFDIQTYYLWVILALGFPGNCATIVTVIKMSPARSLTVYIALLAVVDNLAILNKLLVFVLLDQKVNIGNFGCKFFGYFGNFLTTFANWLLVAMSIERFAAVWFPFKVGQIWTFKKSLIAVVLLAFPLSVLFLHLFWMVMFVMEDDQMFCDIHDEYRFFMMHIWFWINIVIYAALPCVLLLIFNLLIVAGIVKAGETQKYLKSSHGNNVGNTSADRHRQITIMLVTAAIMLVILTTPRCVMLILTPYWTPVLSSMEGAVKYLIDTTAFVLCDLTHAINFYVYSLSAKKFRHQFIELFVCGRKKKMTPTNTQYVSLTSRPSVKIQMTPLD